MNPCYLMLLPISYQLFLILFQVLPYSHWLQTYLCMDLPHNYNKSLPMRQMILLVLVILLTTYCYGHKLCEPFGLRVFYSDVLTNPDSASKILVYFNTDTVCEKSYVQVVTKTKLIRVPCPGIVVNISFKNGSSYQTVVHQCPIDQIQFDEAFNYNVYGWGAGVIDPIPISDQYIKTTIANPTDPNKQMQIIVLADWGPIKIKNYTEVVSFVAKTINNSHIDGLMVLGDIAYDFDTNNCLNYESYLEILYSSVGGKVPIIQVTGNHQHNSPADLQLFQTSFKLYNIDSNFAAGLYFGSLFIAAFDPYDTMYKKKQTEDICLREFTKVVEQGTRSNRFVLPTSHYPLACSGSSEDCVITRLTLKEYFDLMFANKVSLYIGAHAHTYQRIHPYFKNGSFVPVREYHAGHDYLLSIVEGVAGNDKSIVESIDKILDETAAWTINQTGFGVLSASPESIHYEHYSTKDGLHMSDEMTIYIDPKKLYSLTR